MKIQRFVTFLTAVMFVTAIGADSVRAQEHGGGAEAQPAHGAPTAQHGGEKESTARPTLSADPKWAGIVVIVILGMFAMAAAVGPIMRSEIVEEPTAAHGHGSHDEHDHHGHGHGHGHGH
jgi:hypothetical protein